MNGPMDQMDDCMNGHITGIKPRTHVSQEPQVKRTRDVCEQSQDGSDEEVGHRLGSGVFQGEV